MICLLFFCLPFFAGPGPIVPDGQGGFVPFTNSRVLPDGSLRPYIPELDGVMLPDGRVVPYQLNVQPEGQPWGSEPGEERHAGPGAGGLDPPVTGRDGRGLEAPHKGLRPDFTHVMPGSLPHGLVMTAGGGPSSPLPRIAALIMTVSEICPHCRTSQ
jgi:hypothetical protein